MFYWVEIWHVKGTCLLKQSLDKDHQVRISFVQGRPWQRLINLQNLHRFGRVVGEKCPSNLNRWWKQRTEIYVLSAYWGYLLRIFFFWFIGKKEFTSVFRIASSVVKNQNCAHRQVHENEWLLLRWSGAETWASAYVVPDDSQARVAWCQNQKLPVEVLVVHNLGNFVDWAHGFFAAPRISLHSLHMHIHKGASGSLMEGFTIDVSTLEFNSSSCALRSWWFFWRL